MEKCTTVYKSENPAKNQKHLKKTSKNHSDSQAFAAWLAPSIWSTKKQRNKNKRKVQRYTEVGAREKRKQWENPDPKMMVLYYSNP